MSKEEEKKEITNSIDFMCSETVRAKFDSIGMSRLKNIIFTWLNSLQGKSGKAYKGLPDDVVVGIDAPDTIRKGNCVVHVIINCEDYTDFYDATKALNINIMTDGELCSDVNYLVMGFGYTGIDGTDLKNYAEASVTVPPPTEYRSLWENISIVDLLPNLEKNAVEAIDNIIYSDNMLSIDRGEDDLVRFDLCLHFIPASFLSYNMEDAVSVFGELEVSAYLESYKDILASQTEDIEDILDDILDETVGGSVYGPSSFIDEPVDDDGSPDLITKHHIENYYDAKIAARFRKSAKDVEILNEGDGFEPEDEDPKLDDIQVSDPE